ncbi:MAG: hypothetical protein NVS3B10_13200 [Polyangiales bacterium]
MPGMRPLLIGCLAALVVVACDKKPESTTTAPATSAPASATASAIAPPSAGDGGACATLGKERLERCDAMAKGDPTIEVACKEAIDRMVGANDDEKCWRAMNPPDAGPPSDEAPE